MTAPTTTLAARLLAQIADDERLAREQQADAMIGHRWKGAPEAVYDEIQRTVLENSRRVLAQCAALREVVKAAQSYSPELEHGDNGEWAFDVTLRALAGIYADREGWGAWE